MCADAGGQIQNSAGEIPAPGRSILFFNHTRQLFGGLWFKRDWDVSGVWVQPPHAQPLGPNAQALQSVPICPAQVFLSIPGKPSQGGGENQSCGARSSKYMWEFSQYPPSPRSCLFLKFISDWEVKCYDLYLTDVSANGWIWGSLSEYPSSPWIPSRKVLSHWCLCGNCFSSVY